MSLIIVNPTKPRTAIKRRVKSKTAKPTNGGKKMAKHRTAAQKRATRRMLAANRAKRHTNPARRYKRRASRTYANPAPVRSYRRRRHHNPSPGTGKGIFGELMSTDGLFMIGAVVATPTVLNMAVNAIMPSSTGYTRTAVKSGIGLGLAWGLYKYLNKKAGVMVGLVTLGSAALEIYDNVMGSRLVGPPVPTGAQSLQASGPVVAGYLRGPRNQVVNGYTRRPTLNGTFKAPEPGTVRFR